VLVVRGRARAHALAVRRAAAIERLADSIDWVAEELDRRPPTATPPPPPPETARREPRTDPTTGLPARAALVDELVQGVETARREGSRLGLALVAVDASGIGLEPAMAEVAHAARLAAPGAAAFRAGEHALALVLPAAGRADAIAAVARLEASLAGTPPLTSSVVELEPGEDAAALLTRAASAS
jgi:hypothetical protein